MVVSARRDFEAGLLEQVDAAYNFARWAVGCAEEAEKVTVEVMLQALRGPTPRKGGLRAWLLNGMRLATLKMPQVVRVVMDSREADTFADLLVPSRKMSSIGARAAGMELGPSEVEKLRRATAGLPFEQREVVLLRDTEELSYREIAAILNISRQSMMLRLWEARDVLGLSLRGSVNAMTETISPAVADESARKISTRNVAEHAGGAQALIDSYIDAEVDIGTAAAFVEHIAHCRECAARLLERSKLVQQIHSVTVCSAPERLRNLIKAYWTLETKRNRSN
jgi:RNA polymerase sigma-70 factor (ECF subfamily)